MAHLSPAWNCSPICRARSDSAVHNLLDIHRTAAHRCRVDTRPNCLDFIAKKEEAIGQGFLQLTFKLKYLL